MPRELAGRSLLIKMPNRLYLPPEPKRTPETTAQLNQQPVRIKRRDLKKFADAAMTAKMLEPPPPLGDTKPSALGAAAPPVETPHTQPKKFQLPDLPVQETVKQTLLQPDAPPDIRPHLDKPLPELLFWDASKLPPPRAKAFDPGSLKARTQTPKLGSTPHLEEPNAALLTADVRMGAAPPINQPRLPMPPSTTTPLKLLDAQKNSGDGTTIDPFTGQPVRLLALSPDAPPLTDALKSLFIPTGNQVGRLPGAEAFGTAGSGAGSAYGISGLGPGSPDGDPNGVRGMNGRLYGGSGNGDLMGMLSPPGLSGTPLRVIHPNNGVFDVVVMQSSSQESFPEAAAALSGRPIYTVYLQVGDRKEWILQYCVPNMSGPIQRDSVVQLGNPTPVVAPYPTVTVRPPEDWRHGADYLLVHGFLDESGRFRQMRILKSRGPMAATTSALLQYLGFWEFRPAALDGRPVKVEVILAVPPDRLSLAQAGRSASR